jgi:hypothetical protein
MSRAALILVGALLSFQSAARAQTSHDAVAGIDSREAKKSPGAVAALASAIVPGAGQVLLRQKRSVFYLAVEAAGLTYYISQNRDGNRQRRLYRNLARTVARATLSPDGPDGSWDYYEHMEKYVESGAFDRFEGRAIDPETDEETFNGAMWLLARQTFWRDPEVPPPQASEEYRNALAFYQKRAVTSEFLWSWSAAPESFQKYRAAIAASNSAFRHAGQTASVLIANHFLSAVDAYASVRMRLRRNASGTTTLSASFAF